VGNDFYRQALELDLRGKREYTEAILSAMGGISKAQLSRLKGLLNLSDEAMEMADRYNIEEYKLRHVLAVAPEFHAEIVRQIIDFNLSAKQVKELCDGDGMDDTSDDLIERLPASAVKMAKASQTIHITRPQDLASALLRQEGDSALARARLHAMRKLLMEAEQYLPEE
jgi:hypothetical protein